MDEAKRRALIKQQVASKKKFGGELPPKAPQPSSKRGPERTDRPSKKQRLVMGLPAVHDSTKPPSKLGVGKGKGLMTNPDLIQETAPVLLREDPQYALAQITSIIKEEDYEDISNHATEAMGETALFSLTQTVLMAKGLLDRCLAREKSLDRVRSKARALGEELDELKLWKVRQEQKLKTSEQAREALKKEVEFLREMVQANEENIRRVKVEAVQEYRDSDALLMELGTSFVDGFDDCLGQVKSSFPDLNVDHINIDAGGQTPSYTVESEGTAELFGEVPNRDEAPQAGNDNVRPSEPDGAGAQIDAPHAKV